MLCYKCIWEVIHKYRQIVVLAHFWFSQGQISGSFAASHFIMFIVARIWQYNTVRMILQRLWINILRP